MVFAFETGVVSWIFHHSSRSTVKHINILGYRNFPTFSLISHFWMIIAFAVAGLLEFEMHLLSACILGRF